ncbi:hypothetical protein RhiirA1_486830, partial [Rhizophagus irregularis]
MRIRQNSIKMIGIITCTTLLFGCSTHEYTTNSEQLYGSKNLSASNYSSESLTIHTVEFSSDRNVNDVTVTLLDYDTGEKLASTKVNEDGKAIFDMVKPDHPYEI